MAEEEDQGEDNMGEKMQTLEELGLIAPLSENQTFPREMAKVTYNFYPNSKQKKEQLKSAHEAYVEPFLSRNGGKIDTRLYEYGLKWTTSKYYAGYVAAMAASFGGGGDGSTGGIPDQEYSFDNATADELRQFSDNDPWVKAGDVVQKKKIDPEVTVLDPNEAIKISEDGEMKMDCTIS